MQTELRREPDPEAVLWVYVTAGSAEEARRLGRVLVEEKLAACANLPAPHTAIYRWEGRLVEEQEHSLILKTTVARFEALRARIRELHSYTLPCIVALPAEAGDAGYLGWVRGEVGG